MNNKFKKGHIILSKHWPHNMSMFVQDSPLEQRGYYTIKPLYLFTLDDKHSMRYSKKYIEEHYSLLSDAFEEENEA